MNQYILHHLTDYSIDEERLKILRHTPYLFRNFHLQLSPYRFFHLKKHDPMRDWNIELAYASYSGQISIVDMILRKIPEPWEDCLYDACSAGHLGVVKLLLQKGPPRFDTCINGCLHYAGEGGNLELVDYLLDRCPNIQWQRPLNGASTGCHRELVLYILYRAPPDYKFDWTRAFYYACEGGDRQLVDMMISKGVKNWNMGLTTACLFKYPHLVLYMIEKGATHCDECKKSIPEHLQKIDRFIDNNSTVTNSNQQ